jgi:hypothetical protein
LSNRHAEDAHSFGQRDITGYVFQRVDREVRLAAHDYRFHLAYEEPFTAHLRQWAILDAVARGSNPDFLDGELGEVTLQLLADPTGLDESKIAPACCNA